MDTPQTDARAPHGAGSHQQGRPRRMGGVLAALGIFIVGALVGAVLMHVGLERPALDAASARLQANEQDLAALRGRLEQANNTAAALEGRLQIEESTRRGLETGLQVMQSELGQARDSLAFYEQLMPPGPKGAVSLRALDIERAGPHLRYRLLLMRSGSNDKAFHGSLRFVATGRLNHQEATVTLMPLTLSASESPVPAHAELAEGPAEGADLLAVEFSDFQRSSGLLGLPPGFEPQAVTVDVLEGRVLRTSRSVELPVAAMPE